MSLVEYLEDTPPIDWMDECGCPQCKRRIPCIWARFSMFCHKQPYRKQNMNGERDMKLSNVWVYTQFVHPTGEKDEVQEEYVSATTADHGEVVAALQALYPNYVGCLIEPFKE